MIDEPDRDAALIAEAPPTEEALREGALSYLAHYASTRASLRRVLSRRVDRWARAHPDADPELVARSRATVAVVVDGLVAAGALDDATFAVSRGLGLMRDGVSRRGAVARLVSKGIDPVSARAALPDDEDTELAAALILARKRRIGAFRAADAEDQGVRRREMEVLVRAGFSSTIARAALGIDREEAEARILELRR